MTRSNRDRHGQRGRKVRPHCPPGFPWIDSPGGDDFCDGICPDSKAATQPVTE